MAETPLTRKPFFLIGMIEKAAEQAGNEHIRELAAELAESLHAENAARILEQQARFNEWLNR